MDEGRIIERRLERKGREKGERKENEENKEKESGIYSDKENETEEGEKYLSQK
jgi:hypothetical protein